MVIRKSTGNSHDKGWLDAARIEVRYRLSTDSTDAVLLLRGLLVNLELGDNAEAQFYFDQFMRVDKKSPFIPLVAQNATKQGSSAVAPVP